MFDTAHYYYGKAKNVANAGQWSDSIKYYLLAYSIFDLMGEEYGFRAARVAGRLSWGFIVEGHFDKAMNYLSQSERLDDAEAAGNYFMAMQYSFRTGAPLEQTRKLAEKFVEKCIDLSLWKIASIKNKKISNRFVLSLVKNYLNYMTAKYRGRKDTDKEKFSKSDNAKLWVVRAQSAIEKRKAYNYLSEAIKAFTNSHLPQYASLCKLERSILEYSMFGGYDKKKKALERIKELIPETKMGITWQTDLLKGIEGIVDINILFLGICETLKKHEEVGHEKFDYIVRALNATEQEHFNGTETELIGQLRNEIQILEQKTVDQKVIDKTIVSALKIFCEIYKSVPLLFGNYANLLKEVLSDKLKKPDAVKQ